MGVRMKASLAGVVAVWLFLSGAFVHADGFRATACEGEYPRHLQGVVTNGADAIYWSWTEALVKTDRDGKVLASVEVRSHAGDLTYHDGKVYVAFNFGPFNQPPGQADSWVIVYDGDTLAELARRAVPELVHGAGGVAYHDGRFIIVGGLPVGTEENYLYEYDAEFNFVRRHVLSTGYTRLGIQTIEYADGAWWIGCYGYPRGEPGVLLRTDETFQLTGRWSFSAGLGLATIGDGRFLIGHNEGSRRRGYRGWVTVARMDPEQGLVADKR